jgi:hypothetical protein
MDGRQTVFAHIVNEAIEADRSTFCGKFASAGRPRLIGEEPKVSLGLRAEKFGFLLRRAQHALWGDGAVCMRSTRPKDFRSIPSATGGIARLACARLRELGKDVKVVLSKAG